MSEQQTSAEETDSYISLYAEGRAQCHGTSMRQGKTTARLSDCRLLAGMFFCFVGFLRHNLLGEITVVMMTACPG